MFNILPDSRYLKSSEFNIVGFVDNNRIGHFDRLYGINKNICSQELKSLSSNTAGGHVRFRTNSKKVEIHVQLEQFVAYSHFSVCGTSGLDVYVGTGLGKKWIDSIIPLYGETQLEKSIILSGKMQDITIVLPLYTGVSKVDIKIERTATVERWTNLKYELPILFYGSSITQGCSASRPGNSYPEIVARRLNANLMNMGFSSGAKGEVYMAEYISKIPMTAMVIEYDHNAPTIEDLENTHLRFVKTIRDANPIIPIVVMSRFSKGLSVSTDETMERSNIIKNTVTTLEQRGDKRIYFIDGSSLLEDTNRDDYFVDGVHPNDYGMYMIADYVQKELEKSLN